jgi:hypothetical protein
MDFLEEIEEQNKAMDNAYMLITKVKTLDDVYEEMGQGEKIFEFLLPFDPLTSDGRDLSTIELVISHFEGLEDYEKCAKLQLIKKCL